MGVLITFIPWVLFWVLVSMEQPEPASFAGFLGILSLVIIDVRKGRAPKFLQLGTLFLFLVLAALALFMELDKFRNWVAFLSHVVLVLIGLISIIIAKPFTLQYAKERAPKEAWNSPGFIHANYVISWVWLAAFLVTSVVPTSRLFGLTPPKWLGPTVSILCLAAAAKFTQRYARRNKAKRGEA